MMKKNKILIVTECPYSGIFTAIVEHAKLFKELGFQLFFVVPINPRDRYGERLENNIKLLEKYGEVMRTPLRRKYWMIFQDKKEFEKLLSTFTDYVLLSYTGYAGKISRLLYRDGKIKFLYHVPQCIDIIRRPLWQRPIEYFFEKYLAKFSTGYIACSKNESEELNKKFGINKNKIITIRNYITRIFKKNNGIKKYNFLIVGRVTRDKGVEKILDIAKHVGMLKEFVVIGDGNLLPRLRLKFPEVKFTGNIDHEEIFRYLFEAKYVVSNSIIEGLPFSIIEAMYCGVVPILSDIASHRELIRNGEDGYLFKNVSELKNIIERSIKMDQLEYKKLSLDVFQSIDNLSKLSIINFNDYFKKYE